MYMPERKLPFRPSNEISQAFVDGIATFFRVTQKPDFWTAQPAVKAFIATLRYSERRLGLTRYYSAKEANVLVERVIRVPKSVTIQPQDLVVTEDGHKYVVDIVQTVQDVFPPCYDVSLARDAVIDTTETVTLFNSGHGDSINATILRGVSLDIVEASNVSNDGLTNGDTVTLMIPMGLVGVHAGTGDEQVFLPPHLYRGSGEKERYWTVDTGVAPVSCFFARGEVHEIAKYQEINRKYGNVFRAQSVHQRQYGAMSEAFLEVKGR